MKKELNLKNRLILALVFITGACVLIVEVLATRILAPYFGNTIFSVSSILAVVLGALSIGYYYGGKLADKNPNLSTFYKIILISGLSVVLVRILVDNFLPYLSLNVSLVEGPLVSSLALFFVPCVLFGMLSPFAIRVSMIGKKAEKAGSISGEIFFFSTAGSIVGSLLAGFVLVPNFGAKSILMGVSVVLISIGLLGTIKTKAKISPLIVLILLFLAIFSFLPGIKFKGTILNKEGIYQNISIIDINNNGKLIRYLLQDRNPSAAIFLDSDEHVFGYTKYYSVYKVLSPSPENILVLGGGAYTIPNAYIKDEPDVTVEVVEIEPELLSIANQYFKVYESERLINHISDGRSFLKDTNKKYDIIFTDVYSSLSSSPHQFSTIEFYNLAKDKLTEDGILIANIIGDYKLDKRSFIGSQIKTFREAFPSFHLFAVDNKESEKIQNFIFVGYNHSRVDISKLDLSKFEDETIKTLSDHEVNTYTVDLSPQIVFTDDFAPTEKLIGDSFLRSMN